MSRQTGLTVFRLYQRLSEKEKEDFLRRIDCNCARLREIFVESIHKNKEARKRRNSHPRNKERDAEIVRLHDKDRWVFRKIAKHFDMKFEAVRKAYHRTKRKKKIG